VLDTAARVFYERGYANASVQDVAEALGILKGSLYHYIDTKEDLLFRLLDETHDEVHRILGEVDAIEGMGPLDKLHLYVRRQVEFNIDNLVRVSVYYHEIDHLSERPRRELLARRRVDEQFVTALIREAQRLGHVDPALDAHGLSRCIFATIIWTYRWYSPARDDRAHVAAMCAAYAVNGVAAGGSAPSARNGRALDDLPSGW
jgi:TetR/AcrR family transcriptional regulator, cholesterol catabolism regulator